MASSAKATYFATPEGGEFYLRLSDSQHQRGSIRHLCGHDRSAIRGSSSPRRSAEHSSDQLAARMAAHSLDTALRLPDRAN